MDGALLQQWLQALDSVTYYQLFRVAPTATYDELRLAFHDFAERFHPDAHLWRPPDEQAAVGRIYRRGAEAWRILSDPALRPRYDAAVANGNVRPEELIVDPDSSRIVAGPARLIDKVRAPGARPFVLRAEELLKNNDPKQAKIQLVMAQHIDKGNPALEAFAKELDQKIAALKK